MANTTYTAVVENGWHSEDYTSKETIHECGHRHRTREAAIVCGTKLRDAKYVDGSWQCNAEWANFKIHDQDGRRVD